MVAKGSVARIDDTLRARMSALLTEVQRDYPAPRRGVLGAEPAWWGAPTPAEAKRLDEAELAERARKRASEATGRTLMSAERTPGLIATDVDGTLLDEDEKVTPRTRAAVVGRGRGRRDIRPGDRAAAAVDSAGGRRTGPGPDGGVRQRRGDL